MSIVIKSNELNTLVYKYLLEAGLSHTAYTMFNEAKLESPLQQFKYDIKSGHLLLLLQKGLILSQIQSHVNLGAYQQCTQPFYLLKTHTCKITESLKQSQTQFLTDLNQNITECIKRTNAIYNTELTNKNYEEIVYEPRGANYFQKFQKFRVSEGDLEEAWNGNGVMERPLKIDGQKDCVIAVWNRNENVVYLAQKNNFDDTVISKVYPCTLNANFQPLTCFKLTHTHLIMVFPSNTVKLINRETDQSLEFIIPLISSVTLIQANPNMPNLLLFQSRNEYFIINIKNMQQIMRGNGSLQWRGFDEYIISSQSQLQLKSLINQAPMITYQQLQNESKLTKIDQISISPNKTFFFTVNHTANHIKVYTFEKQECLYAFDFTENEEQLKQVIWTHRNEVDYLCILTDTAIRVWEVELNSYCLKIELDKYELKTVHSIASLEKNETETFLLALGSNYLLVSDIANQKVERVESPPNATHMQNAGRNSVYVSTEQHVYFLDGQRLADLFK